MRRKMGKVGMQLSPKILHELSRGIFQIRNQGVTRLRHTLYKIIQLGLGNGLRRPGWGEFLTFASKAAAQKSIHRL